MATRTGQDPYLVAFGRHVRSLRRARRLKQCDLALRANLSPDTIRRIESGSFSASLTTLRRLGVGLGLSLASLVSSLEAGEEERHELGSLLVALTPEQRLKAIRVLRAVFEG